MADVDGDTGVAVQTDSVDPVPVTPGGEPKDAATGNGTPEVTEGQAPEQAVSPEAFVQFGDKTFTQEEAERIFNDYANDTAWKTKNAQRGEELNALAKALDARLAGTATGQTTMPNTGLPQSPHMPEQNTPGITGEQLQDMILNSPDQAMSVIGNLINNAVEQQIGTYDERTTARNQFLSKYGDFHEVTATPEFQQFQASNPAFNDVNAYFALKVQSLQAQVEDAKKAGFLEGEANAIKNQQAKQSLKVLGRPGVTQTTPNPANVKNMNAGERLNAATEAIIARRNQGY